MSVGVLGNTMRKLGLGALIVQQMWTLPLTQNTARFCLSCNHLFPSKTSSKDHSSARVSHRFLSGWCQSGLWRQWRPGAQVSLRRSFLLPNINPFATLLCVKSLEPGVSHTVTVNKMCRTVDTQDLESQRHHKSFLLIFTVNHSWWFIISLTSLYTAGLPSPVSADLLYLPAAFSSSFRSSRARGHRQRCRSRGWTERCRTVHLQGQHWTALIFVLSFCNDRSVILSVKTTQLLMERVHIRKRRVKNVQELEDFTERQTGWTRDLQNKQSWITHTVKKSL